MDISYMEYELSKVKTTPGNPVRVKLMGDVDGTKWLSIRPETFDAIEKLLIEMEGDE